MAYSTGAHSQGGGPRPGPHLLVSRDLEPTSFPERESDPQTAQQEGAVRTIPAEAPGFADRLPIPTQDRNVSSSDHSRHQSLADKAGLFQCLTTHTRTLTTQKILLFAHRLESHHRFLTQLPGLKSLRTQLHGRGTGSVQARRVGVGEGRARG